MMEKRALSYSSHLLALLLARARLGEVRGLQTGQLQVLLQLFVVTNLKHGQIQVSGEHRESIPLQHSSRTLSDVKSSLYRAFSSSANSRHNLPMDAPISHTDSPAFASFTRGHIWYNDLKRMLM